VSSLSGDVSYCASTLFRASLRGICFTVILLLVSCAESVRLAEKQRVHVAEDSDVVRRIISLERDLQEQERKARTKAEMEAMINAEMFGREEARRRREFLKMLDSSPGFDLELSTDAEVLKVERDCRCEAKEMFTTAMAKIKITSGRSTGRVGWICENKIRRLRVWP
jgi:hypothetical protein